MKEIQPLLTGLRGFVAAALITVLATVVAQLMLPSFDHSNVIMVYLLGVVFIATRYGRGPSVFAAAASVVAYDFFCVPPYLTLVVSDTEYLVTLAVMLLVGLLLSSLTVEVRQQADKAASAALVAEREHMRNTLLSALSHDLRTPLATIQGASGTLLDEGASLSASVREELSQVIHEEAVRMNRLVTNLLEMTRLQSGTIVLKKEWHSVEELIGAALTRLEKALANRQVVTDISPDLPLVPMDDVLVEHVLLNLIENALKYSREGAIVIKAYVEKDAVRVEVRDRGPGFAAGENLLAFEKFYRGINVTNAGTSPGVGLGLSICKAIIEAHGGTINARNNEDGGACVSFILPASGTQPTVENEPAQNE